MSSGLENIAAGRGGDGRIRNYLPHPPLFPDSERAAVSLRELSRILFGGERLKFRRLDNPKGSDLAIGRAKVATAVRRVFHKG